MTNREKPAVLITGAGSGIGAASAQYFSQQGHQVVLVGRTKSKLHAVSETLKTDCHTLECDLTNENDTKSMVAKSIERFPNLGILINNAGIFERGLFEDSSDDMWRRIFESNLLAPLRLSKFLIPHFRKMGGGSILNIASTAGLRPVSGMTAYSSLKASLISLTQSLALELSVDQIRVNCICPGIVETPLVTSKHISGLDLENLRETWAKMHPLGRVGKPSDIAFGIYQLTCSEASWITGVVLPIDGGISLT